MRFDLAAPRSSPRRWRCPGSRSRSCSRCCSPSARCRRSRAAPARRSCGERPRGRSTCRRARCCASRSSSRRSAATRPAACCCSSSLPSGALLANAASFAFSAATARLRRRRPSEHRANDRRPSLLRDSLRGARSVLSPPRAAAAAPRRLARADVRRRARRRSPRRTSPAARLAGARRLVARRAPGGHDRRATSRASASSAPRWQRRLVGPLPPRASCPTSRSSCARRSRSRSRCWSLSGACGLYSLGLDARVRDAVPDHLFARAMTLNTAGLMTLQGIGFAAAGAIAEATGPAAAIALAGACGIVSTAVLLRRRRSTSGTGLKAWAVEGSNLRPWD